MMNKKAQLFETFTNLALGVVALMLILTVAFLMMAEGKDQTLDLEAEDAFTSVAKTLTTNSFTTFVECVGDLKTMTVTNITNVTGSLDNDSIPSSGNWTVANNNQLNFSDDGLPYTFPATASFNVTYSCNVPSYSYNGTSTLQNATSSIPGWVPLIIVAVIGGVLLSLVALFKRR